QRGYISRLEFRSGNDLLKQEVDLKNIDVLKVILNYPLAPHEHVILSTPFHVRLPYNFSGTGYQGHVSTISNWYPQIALYNNAGWHASSFTEQTNSGAETGGLNVTINVPSKYQLYSNDEFQQMVIDSSSETKTLQFVKNDVNNFSWVASVPGYATLHAKNKQKDTIADRANKAIQNLLAKSWLPAIGYNAYDGFQIGAFTQNLSDTESRLTYFVSSLYGTNSNRLVGLGTMNYYWQPERYFKRADAGISVSAFSTSSGRDSLNKKIFAGFFKFAPYIKLLFPIKDGRVENSIELKTFIIGEQQFKYVLYSVDSFYHPALGKTNVRYLNQLTFHHTNKRSLYPYDAQLQLQQASSFYRLNGELHYFYNYAKGGGMQVRLFASKFGYLGSITSSKRFETLRYQPKLTALTGNEDYTYSDYFIGRNEFDGFNSQQMMMRDGGLKLRTDLFQDLQGRSDNWIASMNLNSTLPNKLFPFKLPIRIFLDAGTYAKAWKKESDQPKFLYVAGLQVSILKELINIYFPLLYSTTFRDNLKSVPDQNSFGKRISFSIDLHRFDPAKIAGNKFFN
ncbi:MAG: hypothetical protein ABI415_09400, partial [Flavitalea sp.]